MSEVNKIRVLGKDYLIKTRRRVGINQVTNLSGIPVDREKIIATLSGAADFSFSEPLEPGDLLEIICTANEGTEKFVQDFTGPGITTNFDDLTMISPGKVVIAKIYCYEEGKYFIVGEGTEKAVFKYKTGDIIVYDNKVKRLIPISPEVHNFLDYPTSRYAPVGVVVIPNSHDVYGNGAAGVVSLNPMSTLTPSTGASDGNDIEEMCWGELSDIKALPELSLVNHLGNTSEIKDSVQGTSSFGCMAIDYSVGGIQNPLDTQTIYLQPNEFHAPSPYDNYGNRSPLYYQTSSPGSIYNSLSDFYGYANTKEIVKTRGDKNYGSWKPTKTVGSDYPAASCCDMYFTEGTKQGDWYLPGFGELGYLVARKKVIDSSLVKLGKYSINVEKNILSSTEVRGDYSSIVDAVNGKFRYSNKTNTGHVYSFLQLSGDGKVMNPNSIGNQSIILLINDDTNAIIEISEDGINYKKFQESSIIISEVGKKLFYKFYKTGYESQEGIITIDSSLKCVRVDLDPILYSVSFNVTPSDAQITYSIDSETYDNTYTSGEKIDIYYDSTIYYRLVREGYYDKENFLKITGDAVISESMASSNYKYEFDVSESDMNFTSEGETKSVTIVSRKLTFSGDVVSNIPYSRNNSDVFIEGQNDTITVSKNIYTYSRSGYVEFIQEESGNRKTVNISQESGGKYVTITTRADRLPNQTSAVIRLSEASDIDISISATLVSNEGSDVNTVAIPIKAGKSSNTVKIFHFPVDGNIRINSVTPNKSNTQIYTW